MDYYSAQFKALIGLLTGDPASPILWNIFLSDLILMPDFEDVFLAGIRVSLLAQADDLLIISLSLTTLELWCASNFIMVNLIKTIILIFGRLVLPLPTFHLGNTALAIKTEEKYVGVNFRTDTKNILADHYKAKARTARYYMTGRLTPKELKQLYMARVDCHLIHAEDVHVSFIRQMLNLHRRSMIAPLFTETGIMPLRVRRFVLDLGHLVYLLGLNNDTYARTALNSSIDLAAKDLIKAATRLPFHCPELVLTRDTGPKYIEDYAKLIRRLLAEWLQSEIDSSEKLYLLHGRREPQKDKAPAQVTSCMRHYLTMVKTQKHREAITSMLLSTHLLAVEVLRYVNHAYQPVPRSDRLCRFCRSEVETPEHALITCESSDSLVQLRATFLGDLFSKLPNLQWQMADLSNTEFLKAIIQPRSTIALVAKYTHEVFEIYYAVPVFRLVA
ncbi:hypothetical protein B0H15DRAFT_971598 [Mycena belliarum]|uniref:Reverse transcriptase domain-containing protein n=1 Tax=Mycena belliarum TaxID=1033014 RepID=A0AAD6XHQ6_9AGAR|nr:hypothetical protein B0H15DRAFT_971598 [Mycena belliae]